MRKRQRGDSAFKEKKKRGGPITLKKMETPRHRAAQGGEAATSEDLPESERGKKPKPVSFRKGKTDGRGSMLLLRPERGLICNTSRGGKRKTIKKTSFGGEGGRKIRDDQTRGSKPVLIMHGGRY